MAVPAQKVDGILAQMAGRRRGVVTREELLAVGLSADQIEARIASGALIRIHPGVYIVGHMALAPYAMEAAALVACRPRALLGGRSSAGLWRLPVEPASEIDLLVVGRNRRNLPDVLVSSISHLAPGELRRIEGLRLASPSLTILDLAADLTLEELTACVHEARVNNAKLTDYQLRATLRAHPNRRGARPLGALLRAEGAATVTRSEAERRALRLMRAHGLDPESDVRLGRYRVDFLFRAEKLIVEVDGFRFHATPERFVADRRRTAALMGMGYVLFPLSWSDLTDGASSAMTRLLAALDERRRQLALIA
jgi:very-short-patch-repair endonuclease